MPRSVLVVEDDTNFCRLLEIYLGRSYTIKTAHSVEQAESLLENERFDCVITDVSLPDRPGWDLVDVLSTTSPDTHMMIMTGLSDTATTERASTLGVKNILVKPQTPLQVKQALDNLLTDE